MKTSTPTFLGSWDQYMYIGAIGFIAIGVLIVLYYEFNILRIRDHKEKYDYVNLNEIRYFWYGVFCLILAAACFFNTIATTAITEAGEAGMRWFVYRCFLIAGFFVIAYFAFSSLVRVYYSKKLARRLHKIRNIPRISPDGNAMRKLSESEEDHHLEASQIEDERTRAFDYDVWIDEKTGYKKIEKYAISDRSEECPECGFYTLKIVSEEIDKAPSDSEEGYVIEHYQCSYCNHRERREVVVSKLSANVA